MIDEILSKIVKQNLISNSNSTFKHEILLYLEKIIPRLTPIRNGTALDIKRYEQHLLHIPFQPVDIRIFFFKYNAKFSYKYI